MYLSFIFIFIKEQIFISLSSFVIFFFFFFDFIEREKMANGVERESELVVMFSEEELSEMSGVRRIGSSPFLFKMERV